MNAPTKLNAVAAQQVLMLELNEVNFEAVEAYIAQGMLPNFAKFLAAHGYAKTSSEQDYDELEPWIQWVTAHTGLPLKDHGVFRLGDIVNSDIEQIWEKLAKRGISVGAISPMNAKCRGTDWDFFVPDPWTNTGVIAPPVISRMYGAIAQAVNDNAQDKISPASLVHLGIGSMVTAKPSNYSVYANYVAKARKNPWYKAIFLDQLLADLFERSVAKHKTGFATLFLNAAAHIQHHYMFSSATYRGAMRNPDWYIGHGQDPMLDVYSAYDRILGSMVQRFPHARIMIATGLHQDPHEELTYYWRLKNHATFLNKIGVEFDSVEPRMSRDFALYCKDADAAQRAAATLSSAKAADGTLLFDVDNRGADLFVMLSYPNDIHDMPYFTVGNVRHERLIDDVAFVAIKNGHHNGIGYFADSGAAKPSGDEIFPLHSMPDRIFGAFGLHQ
jgi:hypothetical protein